MSASEFRRYALIFAPLVAGLLIVVGAFVDPDIAAEGRELAREYAENPGRIQISALALHFAFALLAIPAFALVGLVRERGAWLANLAGLFAVLGMTTLPGALLVDFYDLAIYGELGGDAWQAVNDRLEELPGAIVMFITAYVGFMLALPVALLAAWRARLLPWWPLLALVVGQFGGLVLPGAAGLVLWAASLAALSYFLWRELPRGEPAVSGRG